MPLASLAEAPSPTVHTRGRLLQVLGIAFGLAVILGNTIGVGILRTPGEIAARLGAISLSELGAMVPRSGGQYVFVRRALGEYPGFIVGWSDWISTCATTSAVAIVSAEYLGVLVPPLAGSTAVVAALLVLGLTAVLW